MELQIVPYEIENRTVAMEQLIADGKVILRDVTIDLDANGRLTNCYFEVVDAPPVEDETADLLEAAAIMGLEPEEE